METPFPPRSVNVDSPEKSIDCGRPRKYAIEYIDRLLVGTTYHDLVELSSAILSSPRFTRGAPDYGLPRFAFILSETLLWFAQATRSGVWTYYEATPEARQSAMLAALRADAPKEIAAWYERGMRDWEGEEKTIPIDVWIRANDEAVHEWLRSLTRANRSAVLDLT